MSPDEYERIEPVIGLEVHCQLRTQTKLFSPAPVRRGDETHAGPNTHVAPLDLGHPGTLPVLNGRAVELALRLGLAMGCEVTRRSKFARKHSFRPDRSKGYEITQRADPLCHGGFVELPARSEGDGQPQTRRVRLRRIQLGEEAARARLSSGEGAARVRLDDDRAGVARVTIVTEPDLRSPREAALFLRKIRRQVRYLGVSDGQMETGSLRCRANLSLRQRGGGALGGRVEIEGLNSFRHLERALHHEAARQARCLDRGERIAPETRRWDPEAGQTRRRRSGASTFDFRYLPEPDLPPVAVTDALIERAQASMPEQPAERKARFVKEIGLPSHAAERLTEDPALADFYEDTVSDLYKLTGGGNTRQQAKRAAHFLLNAGRRVLARHRPATIDALSVTPGQVATLVYLLLEEDLPRVRAAAEVLAALLNGEGDDPETIAREKDLLQTGGEEELEPLIQKTLERHSKNVHRYKSGKKELIHSFVGEVCAAYEEQNGTADPKLVRRMIEERLN